MSEALIELTNALTLAPEKPRAEEMIPKIFAVENFLGQLPQLHVDIKHHFAEGIYLREGVIPKGAMLTGLIHKSEHLNVICFGDVSVWTEDGMKRIKGPAVVHSNPGIKRVMYAHEDTMWINVFRNPTSERDPEKVVSLITTNNYQEFLEETRKNMAASAVEDKSGGTA